MKTALVLAGILIVVVWLSGCTQQPATSPPTITPGNVTENVSAEIITSEEAQAIEAILNETAGLAEELEEPQVDSNFSI